MSIVSRTFFSKSSFFFESILVSCYVVVTSAPKSVYIQEYFLKNNICYNCS